MDDKKRKRTTGVEDVEESIRVQKKRKYLTRSKETISDEQDKKRRETFFEQTRRKGGGGIGSYGFQDIATISKYKPLSFHRISMLKQTKRILQTSIDLRKRKKTQKEEGTYKKKEFAKIARKEVGSVNRRAQYANDMMGYHSLRQGYDIFAMWTSKRSGKSKGYSYQEIARKLDVRLGGSKTGVKYWKPPSSEDITDDVRRRNIAKGMKYFIQGKKELGLSAFQDVGLTNVGRKWAFKFTTIMLAEKSRQSHGLTGKKLVEQSLSKVGKKTFTDIFQKEAKKHAPFVLSADVFKKK